MKKQQPSALVHRAHPLEEGEKLSHPGGAQTGLGLDGWMLLHAERSHMRRIRHPVRIHSECLLGVLDRPLQEEAPENTQDILGGLYLSTGLGTPWKPPRRAGESAWKEERLGTLPDC